MGAMQRRKGGIEEWRAIRAHGDVFRGRYEVSNKGRVRAAINNTVSGSKPGRILFQGIDNKGYAQVYLHYGGGRKMTVKVHRLVADAFLGEKPSGYTIDHINGEKTDNHLENLEYVTNKENINRAIQSGLWRPHPKAWNKHIGQKIDLTSARDIRRRVANGCKRKHVAQEFGIHAMTVGEIVRGEIWAE